MAHKGHPLCQYTSKAACELARRTVLGPCSAMLSEDRECPHLATDKVNGKGYCGQHIGTVYRADNDRARKAALVQAMDRRIDDALEYHAMHPSVWDRMPLPKTLDVDRADIWWNGQSGIGIHVPTGMFVVEKDSGIVEWEGPDA